MSIPIEDSDVTEPPVQDETATKVVGAWVSQLGRTLKTCRLYDGANPTVVRFRDELARALRALLQAQGPVTLRFTPDDVLCGEASLYPAKSRDDNLALPFYRDGIRSLTFRPGLEPRGAVRRARRGAPGHRARASATTTWSRCSGRPSSSTSTSTSCRARATSAPGRANRARTVVSCRGQPARPRRRTRKSR